MESEEQEWLIINAVRQAFGIGRKVTITYAEAVALAVSLAPELVDREGAPAVAFEAQYVRLYRERASARSKIEEKLIEPGEVVDREISQLRAEVKGSGTGQSQTIESEIERLQRLKPRLALTNWTETQAIQRDADAAVRTLPISNKGQGYREWQLPQGRRLRVRILHPDPPEARSGVDLVYESYWEKHTGKGRPTTMVRIAALQYKMWDGKVLYTSQAPNLPAQMERMQRTFCSAGFCDGPGRSEDTKRRPYRFPYCSVFLRPTDKKQTKDAWQVTHAWQIPICEALRKLEETGPENKVLRSKVISNSSVTQGTFEELYNRGMLGSRYVKGTELRDFYRKIGIFDNLDRVVVHCQEY